MTTDPRDASTWLAEDARNLQIVAQNVAGTAEYLSSLALPSWGFRYLELLLRTAGRYDSADAMRQTADKVDSGGVHKPPRHWVAVCRVDSDDERNWHPVAEYREKGFGR
jgi:hypothetical protein